MGALPADAQAGHHEGAGAEESDSGDSQEEAQKDNVSKVVTRTFTKLVDQDFTWKDPKAAEKVGMPMMDYVIGGMDRSFKLKLFHTLHAAEQAGLSPGITSAFRDDYRQSIASGLKAASDRSYHGGSFRGGYGHGLAADVVSVKGATKAERWVSTEALWKWIDAHGKEYGIGRPYLDRDPPHVAPIDGKEYASRRGGAKTQHAEARCEEAQAAGCAGRSAASKRKARRASCARSGPELTAQQVTWPRSHLPASHLANGFTQPPLPVGARGG